MNEGIHPSAMDETLDSSNLQVLQTLLSWMRTSKIASMSKLLTHVLFKINNSNILDIMFSNTLNVHVCSSLNIRDQVSRPYKRQVKGKFLYFNLSGFRKETGRQKINSKVASNPRIYFLLFPGEYNFGSSFLDRITSLLQFFSLELTMCIFWFCLGDQILAFSVLTLDALDQPLQWSNKATFWLLVRLRTKATEVFYYQLCS
jgi:hypothetical protein